MKIKNMNKKASISFALLIACCFGTGFGATADQSSTTNVAPRPSANKGDLLFGKDVVAKGKGFEITRGTLAQAAISIKSSAMATGRNLSSDQSDRLEREVLERLIQIQLLLAKATEAELTKSKELADKRFETIRKRAGSEAGSGGRGRGND